MKKEKFNASKLTKRDLIIIDNALCHLYNDEIYATKKNERILLVKRKIEWLLTYANIKQGCNYS